MRIHNYRSFWIVHQRSFFLIFTISHIQLAVNVKCELSYRPSYCYFIYICGKFLNRLFFNQSSGLLTRGSFISKNYFFSILIFLSCVKEWGKPNLLNLWFVDGNRSEDFRKWTDLLWNYSKQYMWNRIVKLHPGIFNFKCLVTDGVSWILLSVRSRFQSL